MIEEQILEAAVKGCMVEATRSTVAYAAIIQQSITQAVVKILEDPEFIAEIKRRIMVTDSLDVVWTNSEKAHGTMP